MTTRVTGLGAIGWIMVLLIVLAFATLALAQPTAPYDPALRTFGDPGLWIDVGGVPIPLPAR